MNYSYSAITKFRECSLKYKYHYLEGLRTDRLASSLFFGKAIDEGLNRILLEKKEALTDEEKQLLKQDEFDVFIQALNFTQLEDKTKVDISEYSKCDFFKSDIEPSFLENSDKLYLIKYAQSLSLAYNNKDDIDLFLLGYKKQSLLSSNENLLFTKAAWINLKNKGIQILKEYRKTILPKIANVQSIQEKVEIQDGDDCLIGYIDAIVSFKNNPDKFYIIDHKTASKPYTYKDLDDSGQLAIYSEYKKNPNVGFIVAPKKSLNIEFQIILGEMKEEKKSTFFNIISDSLDKIEASDFIQKESPNKCFSYGRKCEFYDLCWRNKMDGLFKKES